MRLPNAMAGRNKPAFTPINTTRGGPKRSSLFAVYAPSRARPATRWNAAR